MTPTMLKWLDAPPSARQNALYYGDNLDVLRRYVADESVDLVYIDPPFNTQQSFLQYDDALEHSVWLTMMRDRLVQAKTLLAPDGSIWVHCDDSEMAYLRVMMDELFGRENFVGNIIWEKLGTRENRTDISTSHDYIIIFAAARSAWKRNLLAFGGAQRARHEVRAGDIARPHRGGEPVDHIVGDLDRLVHGLARAVGAYHLRAVVDAVVGTARNRER